MSTATCRGLLILVFVSVASVAQLRAELNLTPTRENFDLDGVKLWHLAFENGTSEKATYQPPNGWTYSGGSNELELQPPGKTQTKVAITKIAPTNAISFEEKDREKLRQKAVAALPEGSLEVKVEKEQPNALQISGKDTYLIEISYSAFGEKFRRYFLLLNLSEGQLQFQLTCRERDYKELAQAFQKSLYSWQHVT